MQRHFHRVLGFFAILSAPVFTVGQTEIAAPVAPDASASEARAIPLLTAEQLDELLGPIALYPDALIAILLPASTMPTDLVLASRYIGAGGDASKLDDQPWDESVRALARYPDVVKWMDDKLSWSIMVGDAFIAQPVDVMQSIQRLRARARAAGTLVDSTEQKVVEDEGRIRIVPAQPEVIYVPVYDPQIVYVPRPAWSVGWYAPVISYRWCYPTGIWMSYDCDWYSWRVWHVYPHWRHDWYYGRSWCAPHPRPPHHHDKNPDYGHGWSPHRGGAHPDSRRSGRDSSTHVVVRDGHRDNRYGPDYAGARGGDRWNGGDYVPDHNGGPNRAAAGGPDRSRDGEQVDGRNGGRSAPGGDRAGRGGDSARPHDPPSGSSPRNNPVVRNTTPVPQPSAPERSTVVRVPVAGGGSRSVVVKSPALADEPAPRVVKRPETPSKAPVVRSPQPTTNPPPRSYRSVDRTATPANPPPVRVESPRARPGPSTPKVAAPPPSPAPERSAVVRVPVASGGSRSVVVKSPPPAVERSSQPPPSGETSSPSPVRRSDSGARNGERPAVRGRIQEN